MLLAQTADPDALRDGLASLRAAAAALARGTIPADAAPSLSCGAFAGPDAVSWTCRVRDADGPALAGRLGLVAVSFASLSAAQRVGVFTLDRRDLCVHAVLRHRRGPPLSSPTDAARWLDEALDDVETTHADGSPAAASAERALDLVEAETLIEAASSGARLLDGFASLPTPTEAFYATWDDMCDDPAAESRAVRSRTVGADEFVIVGANETGRVEGMVGDRRTSWRRHLHVTAYAKMRSWRVDLSDPLATARALRDSRALLSGTPLPARAA